MLNILKMDLRKLIKARFAMILLIILFVVSAFVVFTVKMAHDYDMSNPETQIALQDAEDNAAEGNVGFSITSDSLESNANNKLEFDIAGFISQFASGGFFLIFVSIFSAIYVHDENENGFIKNISGNVRKRSNLFLSKLIPCLLFIITMILVSVLGILLMALILGVSIEFNSIGDFMALIGSQILIHLFFSIFIMGIAVIFNGSGWSMSLGIITASGMLSILISGFVNTIIRKISPSSNGFNISKYLLSTQTQVSLETSGNDLLKAIGIAAVYAIVFTVIAMLIKNKRDVK